MKIVMTGKLLGVLCLIQGRLSLARHESMLGITDDSVGDTKKYYFGLPDSMVGGLGLKKNERCFEAIISFGIPKNMTSAEANALRTYEFTY